MGTPDISLILTRPAGANARFVDQLPQQLRERLNIFESPLIDIVPVEAELALGADDSVIFTSSNAVRFAPKGETKRAFCVGESTTAAAHNQGWQAIFAGETADALVAFLQAYPLSSPIWHLCGRHTRGEVAERLTALGMPVTRITLYDQVAGAFTAEARSVLSGREPVIAPLFSPRTAMRFAEDCPKTAQPYLCVLSAAVAEPLADLPRKALEIAESPTAVAMIGCIEKLLTRVRLG